MSRREIVGIDGDHFHRRLLARISGQKDECCDDSPSISSSSVATSYSPAARRRSTPLSENGCRNVSVTRFVRVSIAVSSMTERQYDRDARAA